MLSHAYGTPILREKRERVQILNEESSVLWLLRPVNETENNATLFTDDLFPLLKNALKLKKA